MIDLPNLPFKITEFGDDDPLVVAAYKSKDRNKPCWCGSKKKFKKCHWEKEKKPHARMREVLAKTHRIFWKRRECLHPLASTQACKGIVIDAHSIQRKGVLEKIIDKHHVFRLDIEPTETIPDNIVLKKIGWRKASTFPGFCAHHDTELFSEIETKPFIGSHEQCVLQAYRAVANECYKKDSLIETLQYQKEVIDNGKDIDSQIEIQMSANISITNSQKTQAEVKALKDRYEQAIIKNDFNSFQSICFFFEGDFNLVSTGMCHMEFTFSGDKLCDIWDLKKDAPCVTHGIMKTVSGGTFFFCWDSINIESKPFIESFRKINDEEKSDIFAQYCFLQSENTYFSVAWWNGLPILGQNFVKNLMRAHYYDGGKFEPSGFELLKWRIVEVRE